MTSARTISGPIGNGEPRPIPAGGTSSNLFEPVQAPRLTSISRKMVPPFLADRAHYESAVAAQPGMSPIPWAGSIGLMFLQSLLVIRVFRGGFNDVTDVTEAKLTEISSASKSVSFDEPWQTKHAPRRR